MHRWLAFLALCALAAGAWWFATASETRLVAYDAATGRVVWSTVVAAESLVTGEPVSAAGRISLIVVSPAPDTEAARPPRLIQLDAGSGAILTDVALPAEPYGLVERWQALLVQPLVTAEGAYLKLFARDAAGEFQPTLVALDQTTGAVRWSHAPLINVQNSLQPPDVVSVGDLVVALVAVGDQAVAQALDARTGAPRWQAQVEAVEELALQYGFGPLIAADEATVFVSGRGRLLALDARTGAVRFTRETPGTQIVLGDDTLYRREGTSTLVALDATSGAERWRYTSPARVDAPSQIFNVAADGEHVVITWECSSGRYPVEMCTTGLAVADGRERWRSDVLSTEWEWRRPPALSGESVLVRGAPQPGEKRLLALDAADGSTRWDARLPAAPSGLLTATEQQVVVLELAPRWRHWWGL